MKYFLDAAKLLLLDLASTLLFLRKRLDGPHSLAACWNTPARIQLAAN
jgi:hypothetical protein